MRLTFLLLAVVAPLGCKTSTGPTGTDGPIGAPDGGASAEGAQIIVNRSAVNVGSLDVGLTGEGTVTLTNVGKTTSGVVIVVPSTGVTATGCTGPLPASASCTLTIVVTPTSAGAFSGTLSITANPGATTPLLISVIALHAGFTFSVSPSTVDLGDLTVGAVVPKQIITVMAGMDLGDLMVRSSGPDVSIDEAATTCTSTLATRASCVVVVNFLAATSGNKSDAIVISGGGPAGKIATIPITARALAPVKLVISPSTPQAFVAGSTITFGVANSGNAPTGLVTAAVNGPNAADYVIVNNTCLILAPLAGCAISLVFNPGSVDAGAARIASLVVTDTGTEGLSVVVALVDSEHATSALAIYPSTIDLGSALVGTTGAATVFTVVNHGAGPSGELKVSTSNIEFLVTEDTCSGATLTQEGLCTFSLALKPVTAGPPKTATLTVTDGASTVERTVKGLAVPTL